MAGRKPVAATATKRISPPRKQKKPGARRKNRQARKRRRRKRLPAKRKRRSRRRKSKSSEETDGRRNADEDRRRTQGAQGGSACRGSGDAFLAGHKSAAQGNADGRRQTPDSIRGGRVRGLRNRAHHHRDGKREEFHRRPLRPFADPRALSGGKWEERASRNGAAHQRHGAGKLHAAEGAAGAGTRRAGGKRFGGRRAVRGFAGRCADSRRESRDRKSTRLNS